MAAGSRLAAAMSVDGPVILTLNVLFWQRSGGTRRSPAPYSGAFSLCSSMEEQFRPKERVGGSSPSRGTMNVVRIVVRKRKEFASAI